MAFELRLVLAEYEKALGPVPGEIRLGSGGSMSREWCQIIADITGRKTVVPHTSECTSLGAAMAGFTGLGYYDSLEAAASSMYRASQSFEPRVEPCETYDELYDRIYRDLYPAVRSYSLMLGEKILNPR